MRVQLQTPGVWVSNYKNANYGQKPDSSSSLLDSLRGCHPPLTGVRTLLLHVRAF